MQQPNRIEKVHRMNLPNRLLLFIPSLMLASIPVFISAKGDVTNLFHENWWADLFFFSLAGISLHCGLATRLVTSPIGIRDYFFPPLYFTVSWTNLKYIAGNPRGVVYLYFKSTGTESVFQRLSGNAILLSTFVDDWENSDLIKEIEKYVPQFTFPQQLITQPKLKIWYHPGIILLYYVICFIPSIFLAALSGVFYSSPIGLLLILASLGFMGGIFGGMFSLLRYPNWIASLQMKSKFAKKIQRVVLFNYLLPFSGWVIVFLLGLIAQFLGVRYSGDPGGGIFHFMAFFIGVVQVYYLPYMRQDRKFPD